MRTLPLKQLLAQIAVLVGTRWQDLLADEASRWTDALNLRIESAWQAFHWPELRVIEQRYFYDGLWKAGSYAAGKIKYHAPTQKYWQAAVATSATPGANDDWTELAEPLYRIVPWDQDDQPPLGDLYSVHAEDPRPHRSARELAFDLNGDGARILPPHHQPLSAWVQYRQVCPRFAGEPYQDGQESAPGEIYYYAPAGECYLCLVPTTSVPADSVPFGTEGGDIIGDESGNWFATDIAHWQRQPIPAFLQRALARGIYADLLRGDGLEDEANDAEQLYQQALQQQMKRIVHQNNQLPEMRVFPGRRPRQPSRCRLTA
ncbi:MAG TPA: hypothetical protein VHC95_07090 [Opitutales bacterium]|nr:hypothetical protein [Opitutales bacterium]